ncbi:RsmE family RNA methyltransferase [Mucisphaera calidilacus]|uniref:16S rRNA (uracil(1498)-N(3))-methyltransferase n=1 Tax=Mucisphaera calidilacus TaxID=2527982 RepID=A0A518C0E2_9BACT|nr:RsmE family RNA methyltransferase [Mucisphaera calidilacus]QDU72677.1 Ribosomal RNA small subunit methyltransferase E [Mucisphaera calidilacus]
MLDAQRHEAGYAPPHILTIDAQAEATTVTNHEVRENRPPQHADGDHALPRFYAPSLPTPNHADPVEIELDPEEARHAVKARRLQPGSPVELIDGLGHRSLAAILHADGRRVTARIEQTLTHPEPSPRITVASALPKGSRTEDLIDMLVQTGASAWVPLDTEHAVVRPDERRRSRWERRALAGLKQSRRLHRLEIKRVTHPDDLAGWTQPVRLLADAAHGVHKTAKTHAQEIAVAIGPEGGWSQRERSLLLDAGWLSWSLGDSVMRVETAAAVASALLRYLNTGSSDAPADDATASTLL